jgi:hypothetical protein
MLRIARLPIAVAVGYVAGWLAHRLVKISYELSLLVSVFIAMALLVIISRTVYKPFIRDHDDH